MQADIWYSLREDMIEKEIASVVQSVNEWDDRTSPEDYPEHLLITSDELADILRNFSAACTISSNKHLACKEVTC